MTDLSHPTATPAARPLARLPAKGQPLTFSALGVAPDVEIVPGFDFAGVPTGMVYDRADIMSPEKSGVYGQSGQLFLTRTLEEPGKPETTVYAASVRAHTKKVWPGALDYTASGMSDAHESELDTVLRETREELGLTFQGDDLTCVATWVPRDGFWSRGALYVAPWKGADVPFNKNDIAEIRWMTAAELAEAARSGAPMKSDMRNLLLSAHWPPQ